MTQEEKQLLLKDLCARLSYGVKVVYLATTYSVQYIDVKFDEVKLDGIPHIVSINQIKPYLRPISTMTSNELDELIKRLNHTSAGRIINKENFQIMPVLNVVWFTNMKEYECVNTRMMSIVIDFLNEYHFDYNDLISMDMAIEAPKDMYKID